jgi:hypothetical protein
MDVQGVFLSTTSGMDVQGVRLSTFQPECRTVRLLVSPVPE